MQEYTNNTNWQRHTVCKDLNTHKHAHTHTHTYKYYLYLAALKKGSIDSFSDAACCLVWGTRSHSWESSHAQVLVIILLKLQILLHYTELIWYSLVCDLCFILPGSTEFTSISSNIKIKEYHMCKWNKNIVGIPLS